MAVYFIRDAVLPKVKIGHSWSPTHRMRTLKSELRRDLQLLKTLPGGRTEESELHKRFKEYRLHGEWFELSDAIVRFIGRRRPEKQKPFAQILRETVKRMVKAKYTVEQIAEALKVSTGTVYNLLNELNG